MIPRGGPQSAGYDIAQFFDSADLADGTSYDYTFNKLTSIPGEYAARFTHKLNDDNLPDIFVVPGTAGPVGGKICLPPASHSDRIAAQWMPPFVAVVTDVGPPMMVQALLDGSWTADDNLDPIEATPNPGGTAPSEGDFVLCARSTDLSKQAVLIFQGGGGGAGQIAFKVTGGTPGPIVTGVQVDDWTGVPIGGGISTTRLMERTGSTRIGIDQMVYAQRAPSGDSGGQLGYAFVLPLGVCS